MVPAPGPDNRNHGFRGENPGFYEFNGQPCVEARQGWFSYELRVKRNLPAGLVVEYWTGFLGPREFEIRVNGVPVATENAPGIRTNEKMEVLYQIPSALTGSGTVTVTFDGEEKYAGPVFGVRTIETPPPGDQERVVMTAHIF